ncbi:hypothetical protein YC2023_019392 [Brassica napus]
MDYPVHTLDVRSGVPVAVFFAFSLRSTMIGLFLQQSRSDRLLDLIPYKEEQRCQCHSHGESEVPPPVELKKNLRPQAEDLEACRFDSMETPRYRSKPWRSESRGKKDKEETPGMRKARTFRRFRRRGQPKLYATTTSSTVYAYKVQMEPYNKSSTLRLCLVLLTRWLTVNHPKQLRKCAFPQARCFEDKDDSKSTSPA